MLEVELTGQHGRDCNEAVTGAASKQFTRWLHHLHVPMELSSMSYRFLCMQHNSAIRPYLRTSTIFLCR